MSLGLPATHKHPQVPGTDQPHCPVVLGPAYDQHGPLLPGGRGQREHLRAARAQAGEGASFPATRANRPGRGPGGGTWAWRGSQDRARREVSRLKGGRGVHLQALAPTHAVCGALPEPQTALLSTFSSGGRPALPEFPGQGCAELEEGGSPIHPDHLSQLLRASMAV